MIEGELGTFLRSRREAITPAEVGLPVGTRRRTPGLRRAELATLGGISVDYLIRLEQGRDTHPSAQVLAALADALRLSDDDLSYLRRLAAVTQGTELCPQAMAAARTVRPTVRAMLEHLEPAPAFVLADPDALDLIDRLSSAAGAAFTDRWQRGAVSQKRTGVKGVAHPEVGLLRLAFETLELPDADRQRLVVYLPADATTAAGLDRLAGRQPGGLRSVSTA